MSVLAAIFEKRAIGDGGDWGWGNIFGGRTLAGPTVNEKTVLAVSVVWACTRTIAEDIAKLPLQLYKRLTPKGKDRVTDSPVFKLIHDAPNEEMGAFDFRQTLTAHCLLWGNGYAEIQRNRGGQPIAMHPLAPDKVLPKRFKDGQLYYEVRNNMGQVLPPIYPEDMFHLRGLGFDGIVGYSVVKQGRESMGLTLAAEKFGGAFFGNNAQPSGVLEHPGKLTETAVQNLRKSWEEVHQGPDNAHKVAVLMEGMKFNPYSVPPNDAQFLETRTFQVEEICRWFRCPPHKVQHLLRATNNNIEHQSIEYGTDTLMPWAVRWEQEIQRKLLPNQADLFAEHLFSGLMRGDGAARAAYYNSRFMIGTLSQNDIRELENENPIENGDTYYVPLNMVPSEIAEEGPQKTAAAPEPAGEGADAGGGIADDGNPDAGSSDTLRSMIAVHTDLIADAIMGVLRVEKDKTERAAKKPDAAKLIAEIYVGLHDEVRSRLGSSIDATAAALWAMMLREGMPKAVSAALVVETKAIADSHIERSRSGAGFTQARADDDAASYVNRIVAFIKKQAKETP